MKLAFICSEKLPSPAIKGGAVQVMLDGILPFFNDQYQITVFSINDPDLVDWEIKNSIEYVRFPKENYQTQVAQSLKRYKFDVIHVFNRPKSMMLYKTAAPDSTFVLSLHNDMFSETKISLEEGEKIIENVALITTVSEYIKQTVIQRYPQAASKIHVLYSGINLCQFTPVWSLEGQKIRKKIRETYQVENKKVILFIGRLDSTKGPHVLIEALQYLIAKHVNIVLVVVGGRWFSDNTIDEYVQSLQNSAKRYGNHVLFTNYIPSEDIPEILLMGDVFVCSSQWHEPLARVHYEAMAAGIPIITTNRGGNAEVMSNGKNGIIINSYSQPRAFAAAIDTLLKQPLLAEQMARNGRSYVEKRHQYRHVASSLQRIYNHALNISNKKTPSFLN